MTDTTPGLLRHWIRCLVNFGAENYPLPGLPLQGNTVILRHFRRSDEEIRQQWAKFTDPHLQKYNFSPRGTMENDLAFQKLKNRIRLAVDDLSGRMVGYASLKPVKGDLHSAELGLCFAADRVSNGYGTEVMALLLNWAVKTLNLKRIILEVDAINERAVRLYLRFGFRKIADYWRKENNALLLEQLESSYKASVIRRGKHHLEILTWKMEWTVNEP